MFANHDGELPMNSLYTELHWPPRCPKEFPDRLKPLGMSTCWQLLVDEADPASASMKVVSKGFVEAVGKSIA